MVADAWIAAVLSSAPLCRGAASQKPGATAGKADAVDDAGTLVAVNLAAGGIGISTRPQAYSAKQSGTNSPALRAKDVVIFNTCLCSRNQSRTIGVQHDKAN